MQRDEGLVQSIPSVNTIINTVLCKGREGVMDGWINTPECVVERVSEREVHFDHYYSVECSSAVQ